MLRLCERRTEDVSTVLEELLIDVHGAPLQLRLRRVYFPFCSFECAV
jgi:hypothetical protein